MANYKKTLGIVLNRTNYGEADRIITFLTPDHGKLRALAKSVRKQKSKLAGGIELFSISNLSLVQGKSDLYTLTGTRLAKHYANIATDLDRTSAGYEMIRLLGKTTEDAADPGYFILAENAFAALDDLTIDLGVANFWFRCRLIKLSGHTPNLRQDISGQYLSEAKRYGFSAEQMAFMQSKGRGTFTANDIKFLRLGFSSATAEVLARVRGSIELSQRCLPLTNSILQTFVRI